MTDEPLKGDQSHSQLFFFSEAKCRPLRGLKPTGRPFKKTVRHRLPVIRKSLPVEAEQIEGFQSTSQG